MSPRPARDWTGAVTSVFTTSQTVTKTNSAGTRG